MKWVVLPYFIVISIGSLSDQDITQGIYFQSGIHIIDSSQRVSKKVLDADLSSLQKILEYVEPEYNETSGDQHYLDRQSSLDLSLLLVPEKIASVSSFIPKKKRKLFILFHSWKSFLHT